MAAARRGTPERIRIFREFFGSEQTFQTVPITQNPPTARDFDRHFTTTGAIIYHEVSAGLKPNASKVALPDLRAHSSAAYSRRNASRRLHLADRDTGGLYQSVSTALRPSWHATRTG
jgi:hypothetical protein